MPESATGLQTVGSPGHIASMQPHIRHLWPPGLALVAIVTFASRASAQCPAQPQANRAASTAQWAGWGRDAANSRFQPASAAGLAASDVPKLAVKWAFNLGDITDAHVQPTVAQGRVYVATSERKVYALDATSGCTLWTFTAQGVINAAIAVGPAGGGTTRQVAIVGDQKANVYALDAATGALQWQVHVGAHRTARITGAPQLAGGVAYVPVSSYEEVMVVAPKYECCTFRGSVVALNAATGKVIWKTYTIADTARATTMSKLGVQQRGPSGAAIWSSPTVDTRRGRVYVATGNNYSDPPTTTSDAVLALDARTGTMLWARQLRARDATNLGCDIPGNTMCPPDNGPDADFGQPPILVTLPNGARALVIAGKSGMAYGLDPDRRGAILWQVRVARGGKLGGSQWGSASDGTHMYAAASDMLVRPVRDSSPQRFHLAPDPATGGGLTALDLATGHVAWRTAAPLACGSRPHCSPAQSAAVTAIPGVVFSGSVDGHLRAYAAATGAIVWDFDAAKDFPTVNGQPAHGGSFDAGGAVVVDGMLFVSSGYGAWGGTPGNVLLAFAVPPR